MVQIYVDAQGYILIAGKISMNNTRIAENLCECYKSCGS